MKRKLTTILVADVKGYSALMAADEADTLDRLRRCRAIMSGLFERHDGRQVNTWGDAVIAEFPSVVEAVRCAVEIQDSVSGENHNLPKSRQMWFRIGVNLGDVMIDGSDLYGDGVNVAARLQGLAEPGGIVVSGTVYNLAHKQLALAFDYVGEQQVKNLDEPVTSYRVRMAERNRPQTADEEGEDANGASPEASANGAGGAAGAQPQSAISRFAAALEVWWRWVQRQQRSVRISVFAIGIFFAVNLLFGSITNPWFLYPSAPFAIYIFVRVRRDRRHGRSAAVE